MPISKVFKVQFSCRLCHAPIVLLRGMLDQAFANLEGHTTRLQPFVAVCISCKHPQTYSVQANPKDHLHPEGLELLHEPRGEHWLIVGSLECELETCSIRLPVFAPSNLATNAELARIVFPEATCECGHPLPPAFVYRALA